MFISLLTISLSCSSFAYFYLFFFSVVYMIIIPQPFYILPEKCHLTLFPPFCFFFVSLLRLSFLERWHSVIISPFLVIFCIPDYFLKSEKQFLKLHDMNISSQHWHIVNAPNDLDPACVPLFPHHMPSHSSSHTNPCFGQHPPPSPWTRHRIPAFVLQVKLFPFLGMYFPISTCLNPTEFLRQSSKFVSSEESFVPRQHESPLLCSHSSWFIHLLTHSPCPPVVKLLLTDLFFFPTRLWTVQDYLFIYLF